MKQYLFGIIDNTGCVSHISKCTDQNFEAQKFEKNIYI